MLQAQTCSQISGSQQPVSERAQVLQDSPAFRTDGLIIFDYDTASGQRDLGVQLQAFANTEQGSILTNEGLSVRLVARYCDGQVREATVDKPERLHWGDAYIAKFDQTVTPMRTPRQWQLTLTWKDQVLSYLLPAIADFEVRWEAAKTANGPAIVKWDAGDSQLSRITADVDDLNTHAYTHFDLSSDTGSLEFAAYKAKHGYTATVAKEIWQRLPGNGTLGFNVHTHRQSDPFYILAP